MLIFRCFVSILALLWIFVCNLLRTRVCIYAHAHIVLLSVEIWRVMEQLQNPDGLIRTVLDKEFDRICVFVHNLDTLYLTWLAKSQNGCACGELDKMNNYGKFLPVLLLSSMCMTSKVAELSGWSTSDGGDWDLEDLKSYAQELAICDPANMLPSSFGYMIDSREMIRFVAVYVTCCRGVTIMDG